MIFKFHKHKYRCKVWKYNSEPPYDRLTILMGCECRVCGKHKLFHRMPFNREWVLTHQDLWNSGSWEYYWEDKHAASRHA